MKRDQWTFWLDDYIFNTINTKTLAIAHFIHMQYSCAFDHLLCEIIYTYPTLGPNYALKVDIRNILYLIAL